MSDQNTTLGHIFYPRSIALVGIILSNPGHWTRSIYNALNEFKYDGLLYLVNRRGGESEGHRVYRDISDIPGNVDYVISTISAEASPGLIESCVSKGVKAIHFLTAGFAETGEADRVGMEAELVKISRKTGIRVIGPNSMGPYCPESRLSFHPAFPKDSGRVGIICQSGSNATQIVFRCAVKGLRFSKVISYGNACDLNESDFLEYLNADPKTEIIGLYVEGVREPQRFRRALAEASRKKAVVLLKGGVTEAGTRAVAGHTGALAGSAASWNALCRQSGVIQTKTMDEFVDVLVTLNYVPRSSGRRVGVICWGGGTTVLMTDEFERSGFKIPPLPPELRQQIREYTKIAGNILGNPMDYSQGVAEPENMEKTANIFAMWDGTDFLAGYLFLPEDSPILARQLHSILEATWLGAKAASKPLVMILEPPLNIQHLKIILSLMEKCVKFGIPVYGSSVNATNALNLVLERNERRREGKPDP